MTGHRPELDSSTANVQFTTAVDVFNTLNAEWEPFVEPWSPTLRLCAIDPGDTSDASERAIGQFAKGTAAFQHHIFKTQR